MRPAFHKLAGIVGLSMALFAVGCSEASPVEIDRARERGAAPSLDGRREVAADHELVIANGAMSLVGREGMNLAGEVTGPPSISADGGRVAFSHRLADSHGSAISVIEHGQNGWSGPRTIIDEGTPDRVAISRDGETIAFVAPANGIAAIWIVPFEGGSPLQITNVGVKRDGPGEPSGFVPVPHRGPPVFEDGALIWHSAKGVHRAVLP